MKPNLPRAGLFCVHVEDSGYKIPQMRLLTAEGHKYVCRDCYLTATAGHISTRPHKDFVTKRFSTLKKNVALVDLSP